MFVLAQNPIGFRFQEFQVNETCKFVEIAVAYMEKEAAVGLLINLRVPVHAQVAIQEILTFLVFELKLFTDKGLRRLKVARGGNCISDVFIVS